MLRGEVVPLGMDLRLLLKMNKWVRTKLTVNFCSLHHCSSCFWSDSLCAPERLRSILLTDSRTRYSTLLWMRLCARWYREKDWRKSQIRSPDRRSQSYPSSTWSEFDIQCRETCFLSDWAPKKTIERCYRCHPVPHRIKERWLILNSNIEPGNKLITKVSLTDFTLSR